MNDRMLRVTEVEQALQNASSYLLARRDQGGFWEGHLSNSALSTATAVIALREYQRALSDRDRQSESLKQFCHRGRQWLVRHQNEDGGWGDTTRSFSNISTTALVWAALAGAGPSVQEATSRCEVWLARVAGGLEPSVLAAAIRHRYGRDHTFSVPILTALALSGRLGDDQTAWRLIPQLPFELAAFPRGWFAALRLPVVSYALPALIAIGLVRHRRYASRNFVWSGVRKAVTAKTLHRLREIQPTTGGYLEATPLTSFVLMSLVGAGLAEHSVVKDGLKFLIDSVREDGSWPIDTHLATWVTTLSVRSLDEANPELYRETEQADATREWILRQQYRERHLYTDALPGGWAWTPLSGGVPDADDTPSALLALKILDHGSSEILEAALAGVTWLLDLQNRDGGIPTFCRGWGTLPFDRSSSDLTAHTLRAWRAWEDRIDEPVAGRIREGRRRGLDFLSSQQRHDGAWDPLWFGNQHAENEVNSTYGTSRVLVALADEMRELPPPFIDRIERATQWLLRTQNSDGGWGGASHCPSSIEETALAVEALVAVASQLDLPNREGATSVDQAIRDGAKYLIDHTQHGQQFPATPIGFYFAKLWYYEELYPVIYSVAALAGVQKYLSRQAVAHSKNEVSS